ncbi:MAG: glycosyltransferase family 2 protein, partial [Deltaproteobacteria bacterium]
MKVTALVPCYNEESSLLTILEKLETLDHIHEVIFVDDCSTDKSHEIASNFRSEKLKVFKQTHNQGKSAAINRAMKEASGDVFIIQDADLEYDPEEIIDVIGPILDGKADVVYGSRFMVKKAARVLYYYHFLANKFLTFLSNVLTNLNMTDIETCYKAFKSDLVKDFEITSSGFGMEVELTAYFSKMPLRIYEVPISYYGRTYEKRKKIGMKDG